MTDPGLTLLRDRPRLPDGATRAAAAIVVAMPHIPVREAVTAAMIALETARKPSDAALQAGAEEISGGAPATPATMAKAADCWRAMLDLFLGNGGRP